MHSSRSLVLAAALLLVACDDPDILYGPEAGLPKTDASFDAAEDVAADVQLDAPPGDAGADGSDAAADAGDAGDAAGPVNGCTTFVDRSAPSDTRQIDFPTGVNPTQYNPPCMQIAVGQTVTFAGSFMHHPLEPFGGDSSNPITSTSTGNSAPFTFPAAGTFGFHCSAHPGIMFGAVLVQ
jgi:plastocyanin